MPFSASIIQRQFMLNTGDNALKLGGACWHRKMIYGGDWARIRLGVLVAVPPWILAGTYQNLNDIMFTLGLMSSSGSGTPGSAFAPQSYLGVSVVGNHAGGATRTYTYTANSGYPYYSCTAGQVFRRAGTTENSSASLSSVLFLPVSTVGNLKRRYPIVIDITRSIGGAGLATVQVYGVTSNTNQASLDFRPDQLQAFLDGTGTPSWSQSGGTFFALTALTAIATVGVADEFGPLDTIEIYWSSTTYPLELYAVGATITVPTLNAGVAQFGTNIGSSTLAYGTDNGGAFQNFLQFVNGSQVTSFATQGTGFATGGTIWYSGYASGTNYIGLPGTSGGFPVDDFQQYTTGSVTTAGTAVYSGVNITSGTGWSTWGTIY